MAAKITYLPGVIDPNAGSVDSRNGSAAETLPESSPEPTTRRLAKPLPTYASVTGDRWAGSDEIVGGDERDDVTDDELDGDDSGDGDGDEPEMTEGERAAFLENVVVRALARKSLSEWEVSKLLTTNGVDIAELEVHLDRYRANRYVDDYDLAENLVESLHRRKGFGRSQIKSELSVRHIAPEIISAAIEALDDDDELRRAIELAEKKAPSLARLDAQTAERRLSAFLVRKGYSSSVIRAANAAVLTPKPRAVRFR